MAVAGPRVIEPAGLRSLDGFFLGGRTEATPARCYLGEPVPLYGQGRREHVVPAALIAQVPEADGLFVGTGETLRDALASERFVVVRRRG